MGETAAPLSAGIQALANQPKDAPDTQLEHLLAGGRGIRPGRAQTGFDHWLLEKEFETKQLLESFRGLKPAPFQVDIAHPVWAPYKRSFLYRLCMHVSALRHVVMTTAMPTTAMAWTAVAC